MLSSQYMDDSKVPNYFPVLTGIRFIAALMVYFHHFNPISKEKFGMLWALVNELHIGVTVFFVLSGFLIHQRYSHYSLKDFSWLPYLKNRFARIYPVYFFILVTLMILNHIAGKSFEVSWINFFLLQGWSENSKFTGIAPAWSLTTEECFYLLAPILFFSFTPRRIAYIPIIVALACTSMVAIHEIDPNVFGDWRFLFLYTFPGRIFEFLAGISASLLLKKNRVHQLLKTQLATLGLLLVSVFVLFCISTLATPELEFGVKHPVGILLNNIFLPIVIATLFLNLIHADNLLVVILKSKAMKLLGKSSYVFYLTHTSFVSLLIEPFEMNWLTRILMAMLISVIIYYCIENPIHRILKSQSRTY